MLRLLILVCFSAYSTAQTLKELSDRPISLKDPAFAKYRDGSALVYPLHEEGLNDLSEKWLSQAVSGLIAAIAQKNLETAEEFAKDELHTCSKDAKDVPKHAKCFAGLLRHVDRKAMKERQHRFNKIRRAKLRKPFNRNEFRRMKRAAGYKPVNRDSYTLRQRTDETPFAQVARYMTNTVRKLKNKNDTETWQETMVKIRKTAEEEKEMKIAKENMKKRLQGFIDNTPTHLEDPVKKEALQMLEEDEQKKNETIEMAKNSEIRLPMKMVREAVKLGLQLSGKNVSNFHDKTLKLVSPRFFSLVKEEGEEDMINLLSPSLFSLHDEGSPGEKLSSLPHLLKGLTKTDQEAWMDFIVEAAGVSDSVNQAQAIRRKQRLDSMKGDEGAPLYFTKKNITERYGEDEVKKVDVFDTVAKKYSGKQKNELDKQGFSFMTEEQIDVLYGKDSPYHTAERIKTYKTFANMDDRTKHLILRNEIRQLAKVKKFTAAPMDRSVGTNETHARNKRNIVLSPVVLSPIVLAGGLMSNTWIVLSPVVFSPVVLTPAVLGPVILSPWVFIPVILSPRVLCPLILNPMIFSPIVLSPLVLHPLILSPGIFNPLVLSPFVLSPFILSPQVFTPIILSPFALSPLILNPMVGSPVVLSPFVLSPLILSPQVLFAVVLSPYALSPLVESKLIASEVVLSPSVLS